MPKIDFKKIIRIKNIISVVLYTLMTIFWITNKAANNFVKWVSVIVLVMYLVMFAFVDYMSKNTDYYKKNINNYFKILSITRTILNIINMVMVVISLTSLVTFSLKNFFLVLFNIIFIIINLISLLIKYLIYKIKKKFKKQQNKSFFGFILNDKQDTPEIEDK